MTNFKGFRDFVELFMVPPTPESEDMLTKPAFPVGYPKKVKKKDFKNTLGGTVKHGTFHPANSLGIDRIKMPQFKDKVDFLRWAMKLGIKVERVHVSPISLIDNKENTPFAQNSIYVEKALEKIKKRGVLSTLIILSKENTIVDGNHHWLALMQVVPRMPVPMFKIDKPFYDIVGLASQYPKVSYSA